MAAPFKHQSLGEIRGKRGDGVIQFLGIKYASLKDRFAASELFEHDGQNVIDGTRLGPTAINPPGGLVNEFGFIQHTLPVPELTISELECLNLNITVPLVQSKTPTSESKVPVFVFVHGGGFALGSSAWPQYDMARFVKLSTDLGTPVIGVSINYRVGACGFLTSAEMRKAGYLSNNGLRDQINAFRWVKKFIEGFGGDNDNVTFIGESAGSASGNFLLYSKEPLFKRYVSMSGTALMIQPLPPQVSDFVYDNVVKLLGAENLSSQERIKKLLDLPAGELATLVPPSLPLLPVVDGEVVLGNFNFDQISSKEEIPGLPIPGRQWCETLLIGDCQFDGTIFKFMLGPRAAGATKAFCSSIRKSLGENAANVLDAYGIDEDLSDTDGLCNILSFVNDVSFFAPVIALAKGWPGKAYVYHFNEPNPWDGEWKGETGHVLDIAYLFQNFNEFMDPAQKEIATQFARDFINFMHGKSVWAPFGTKEGAQVYGPSGNGVSSKYVEGVATEGSGRRNNVYNLAANIPLHDLAGAWTAFFTGTA